jgi:hypothetical protein
MLLDNNLATHFILKPYGKNLSGLQLATEGRKRKFCSLKCKLSFINNKHQNYATQQRRDYERKAQLINMKGGKCQICGYNKNQSALCFHHTDPKTKSFQIDIRKCSNSSLSQSGKGS